MVKCVVSSKQRVTAVEDYEGNCRRCDARAMYPVYHPSYRTRKALLY